jgi:hypothetical protein
MPKAERFFSCFLLRLRLSPACCLQNSKFDEKAAAKVRLASTHGPRTKGRGALRCVVRRQVIPRDHSRHAFARTCRPRLRRPLVLGNWERSFARPAQAVAFAFDGVPGAECARPRDLNPPAQILRYPRNARSRSVPGPSAQVPGLLNPL